MSPENVNHGRRRGDAHEVAVTGENVLTFRGGELASMNFHLDRDRALADLGWEA